MSASNPSASSDITYITAEPFEPKPLIADILRTHYCIPDSIFLVESVDAAHTSKSKRWRAVRLLLGDGELCIQALLSAEMHRLVDRGEIMFGSYVKLQRFHVEWRENVESEANSNEKRGQMVYLVVESLVVVGWNNALTDMPTGWVQERDSGSTFSELDQAKVDRLKADLVKANQAASDQVEIGQIRSGQVEARQVEVPQIEARRFKEHHAKVNQAQVDSPNADDYNPFQSRPGQFRTDQIGADQVKADEVKADDLKPYEPRPNQYKLARLKSVSVSPEKSTAFRHIVLTQPEAEDFRDPIDVDDNDFEVMTFSGEQASSNREVTASQIHNTEPSTQANRKETESRFDAKREGRRIPSKATTKKVNSKVAATRFDPKDAATKINSFKTNSTSRGRSIVATTWSDPKDAAAQINSFKNNGTAITSSSSNLGTTQINPKDAATQNQNLKTSNSAPSGSSMIRPQASLTPTSQPVPITPLGTLPHLEQQQNYTVNVLCVIASLSEVTPGHINPFIQRRARLTDPSTEKQVQLTVFSNPKGFTPPVGSVVLLLGLKNHRFEGGSLNKYVGDRVRWWYLNPRQLPWCNVDGLLRWWEQKRQSLENGTM